MFLDFSIVPYAALIILLVLGLLVVLFWVFVKRDQDRQEEAKLVPTEIKQQLKTKFKSQQLDPFQVRISGDSKTVSVNGQVAVFHADGKIDSPVVAKHKDKHILTYTVGGRALWCSIRQPGSSKWDPPVCVTVSPDISTASAYPLIYRVGSGKLYTTYSNDPIATFEPSPLDTSEPTTLALTQKPGLVLLVYAAKDRGLYRLRSVDSGKTWSASHLVVADASACRPKLFETKSGIQLVYLSFLENETGKAELYLTSSSDNGITFHPVAQKIGPDIIQMNKRDLVPPSIFIQQDDANGPELAILDHRIAL